MKVCSLCHSCYEDSVVYCTEENHPPLSETRDGNCEIVPGYRLDYLLEAGANFEVYRAHQTAYGRSCLIKILSADKKTGRQFLREARLAATLFHPNIVDVYEAGALDSGELFVIAEDADGQTLSKILKTDGVPKLLTSIEIIRQAAEALHAIHLQGLLHRAIRPENIVLTTDTEKYPVVRIQNFDFGGVVEHSIVSNKFLIDSALDSLKYFAPEQFACGGTSVQSDVYSLGIVFYELLAGAPPFDAQKAAALIEKHRNQLPPEIKIDNFNLRMLLTHTLTESLQKQPHMRQSSADAFARQIRHIEQLATHVSTPPPAVAAPPIPPRSAGFAAAAAPAKSFQTLPVRHLVIETPKESLREIATQATGTAEEVNELFYTTKVEDGPIGFNNEGESEAILHAQDQSVISFEPEDEPLSALNLDVPVLPEVREIAVLLPQVAAIGNFEEKYFAPEPRRSRLKILRKKLHARLSRLAMDISEDKPGLIEEVPEIKTVEVQSALEISASKMEPDQIVTEPVHTEPTKVLWRQPDDDIPSIADVMEALSREHVPETPVVQPEPEEITLVSANSKPIKIEWEQPAAPQYFLAHEKFSDEIQFFPTVLGGLKKTKTPETDSDDSVYSDYKTSMPSSFSVDYHSLMIGAGGLVALIGMFLFGSILIPEYVQSDSATDSVAAKTAPAQTNPVSSDQQRALKNFEKPVPDDNDLDASQLKPLPTSDRAPLSAEKPQNSTVKSGVQSLASKTRAITSDKDKIRPKPEPAKNSTDKKPLSAPNKTDEFTRPRIVKNPRS